MAASFSARTDGKIYGSTDNQLIDTNTSGTAQVGDKFLIDRVIFHKNSTLSATVTVGLGYSGSNEFFVPLSVGITTADINSRDVIYHTAGKKLAVSGTNDLVLVASGDVNAGEIAIYLEGYYYDNL